MTSNHSPLKSMNTSMPINYGHTALNTKNIKSSYIFTTSTKNSQPHFNDNQHKYSHSGYSPIKYSNSNNLNNPSNVNNPSNINNVNNVNNVNNPSSPINPS
jgi:hypothetical protein